MVNAHAEFLWIAGVAIIALLVWFIAARSLRREREAIERLHVLLDKCEEYIQVITRSSPRNDDTP